ncbi:helix-turn-helix domain-containing protein [Desulfolithobacter sp.]
MQSDLQDQHPSEECNEQAVAENVGSYLQRLRLKKELSVEEVAKATRISHSNIRAIEAQAYHHLPADTFTKGLISLYAAFLGENGSELATRFLEERDREQAPGRRSSRQKALRHNNLAPKTLAEPAHISSAAMAGFLLLFITLSFTGFCVYTSWNPFAFLTDGENDARTGINDMFTSSALLEENISPTATGQEKTSGDQVSSPENSGRQTENTSTEISAIQGSDILYTLRLAFDKDCRITVTIDDQQPAQRTFKEGEEQLWQAGKTMVLQFDTPEAASLTLNDKKIPFPVPDGTGKIILRIPEALLDL